MAFWLKSASYRGKNSGKGYFGVGRDEKIETRTIADICHDHLMDTCEWHDKFVFRSKSTEPYKGLFNKPFDSSRWDDDIKL